MAALRQDEEGVASVAIGNVFSAVFKAQWKPSAVVVSRAIGGVDTAATQLDM